MLSISFHKRFLLNICCQKGRTFTYRQGAEFPINLDKEVRGEIVLLRAASLTETEPGGKGQDKWVSIGFLR